MNKRITIATALFALILWPLAAAACDGKQGDKGARMERHLDRMAEHLELTESQIIAIQEVMESRHETMPAHREAMQDLHDQMEEALEAENTDAAEIGGLMLQKKAMQDEMKDQREATHAQILDVLDDEQKATFEAMIEKHGGPMHRRSERSHRGQRQRHQF